VTVPGGGARTTAPGADLRALLTQGEVAVIGLGRSGSAAARLAAREGARVYASDVAAGPKATPSQGVAGVAAVGIADALAAAGVAVEWGAHDVARIAHAALAVVSPGVPPQAPAVAAARDAGVPVVSEVELALWFLPGVQVIAVTGTNGKTTTTALIAHLLRAQGLNAVGAGNIGLALSEVALAAEPPAWVALEMSSFQLHDTHSLAPAVGVLTNLSPDHLDRYGTLDEYYADKDRLFVNATSESVWVTNADDVEVLRRTSRVRGRHLRFSLAGLQVEAAYDEPHETIRLLDEPLMVRSQVPLLGDHNVANVLAATLAVAAADAAFTTPPARERLRHGVQSFHALPNRLEVVADAGGVVWINDSKATNVASARVAIDGMTRPAVVLLGGRHKGESYAALVAPLAKHARHVIAYGEAGAQIEADLKGLAGRVPLERLGSSFEEVMRRARAVAVPGDAVLLAPACSSFDMFTNYEERGATFRRLAAGAAA
jgi:UDP-N-acetylmuramoylalanine--D-glutamate ligase